MKCYDKEESVFAIRLHEIVPFALHIVASDRRYTVLELLVTLEALQLVDNGQLSCALLFVDHDELEWYELVDGRVAVGNAVGADRAYNRFVLWHRGE